MKKKILTFFLAGIMTFSMVPTEAFAETGNTGLAARETFVGTEEAGQEESSTSAEEGLSAKDNAAEEGLLPENDTKEEGSLNGTAEEGLSAEDAAQEQENAVSGDAASSGILPQDDVSVPEGQEEAEEKTDLPDTELPEKPQRSRVENSESSELEHAESEEAEKLPSVDDDAKEQLQEEWTPPMGGMAHMEGIEVSAEAMASLEVLDAGNADGTMGSRSIVFGSQKYDSSWDVYSTNYIYNQLKKDEKNYWDVLDESLRELLNGTQDAEALEVPVDQYGRTERYYCVGLIPYQDYKLTKERATELILMFSYSNPQYYFLGHTYLYGQNPLTGKGLIVPTVYDEFANGNTRKAETAKVKAKIDTMISKVKAGKTDVEKAKIAHDLICQKVLYDHTYETNPHTLYHQSAYSVLCENYTVCAGYTKAFSILMNGAGVDTISVTSYAHAWNMVSLNDSWYHIDCTWDDTDGRSGYGEMVYEYFNRSTDMITGSGLDSRAYHQMESFYRGIVPKATQDSGATVTTIGTIGTPSAKAVAPKISKRDTSDGFLITLSTSTPGADIYYTVDGITPSSAATRSSRYTGSFEVAHNTTVKAIAVCDRMWDSEVASITVKKPTFTVKFDAKNGSKVSSKKVVSGSAVKKPSDPKRSKYTFDGWYTNSKYTKKWNFSNSVDKDMTLYAKWKKVSVGEASIKKLTNVSGKKVKVTINKVSGAKGYQVRYATNSKMKSAQSANTSTKSKNLKNLKKDKKYYIQVRAYKKDSKGNKVYGAWSKKKTVVVRK